MLSLSTKLEIDSKEIQSDDISHVLLRCSYETFPQAHALNKSLHEFESDQRHHCPTFIRVEKNCSKAEACQPIEVIAGWQVGTCDIT